MFCLRLQALTSCLMVVLALAVVGQDAANASATERTREKNTIATFAVAGAAIAVEGATDDGLFDDFDGGKLDPGKWMLARRQWGGKGANGGVVPGNVSIRDGCVILEAHGDQYQGHVKGVERRGKEYVEIDHGRRVGACLVTKERFASGRYEVRAKAVQRLGASSAFWTFYYDEIVSDSPNAKTSGNKKKMRIINHEIDIELPGRPKAAPRDVGYDWALCNTWIGEKSNECTIGHVQLPQAVTDGKFHTYRFDWHTGGNGVAPRVDFYVDGERALTTTTHVPFIAGQFWVGAWFPKEWAGKPDFDTETMEIDWVRITPFHEPGDQFREQPDPTDGFARIDQWPAALVP